jgi:uncharacterized protein YndB with AHSA1/START domain
MRRQGGDAAPGPAGGSNLFATVRCGRESFTSPIGYRCRSSTSAGLPSSKRLKALDDLKRQLETAMLRSTFVYVTYIRATPERLWSALTDDVEFMKQYWFGMRCESQWTAGSPWQMVSGEGLIINTGEIAEAEPPRRLVIHWQKPELKAEGDSHCTMELEPSGAAVKLSITHTIEGEPSKLMAMVSASWPKIISNLKSLLETGSTVLREP